MQIPQPNINAYRKPMKSLNASNQLIPTLCNGGSTSYAPLTGAQVAFSGGMEDEGAPYRGYGSYLNNAPCNLRNIYDPIYYNQKSSIQPDPAWFL